MNYRLLRCAALAAVLYALHPALLFGQSLETQAQQPPGRLIDIGGRKLHLYCVGRGTPTVVLIPGGGAFSVDWALVQPPVADSTRVCSYDRAGYAWSGPGPADETVEQTIGDLHRLLRVAHEKAPYVLVGASVAGIFARAYQRAYPIDVAGLVFTNSSNRIGMNVNGKVGLIWNLTEAELRSALPLPPTVSKGAAPTEVGEPFNRLPADIQPVRQWLALQRWQQWEPSKANAESLLSWRREFLKEFEETESPDARPLGRLPVVVISSDPIASDSAGASHDGAAAPLDFLSANTAHITATGSGHEIHLYQPDTVIHGLWQVAAAIRNGTRLEAPAQDCRAPWKEPIQYVAMPASPFQALPSADGCWAFVSLVSQDSTAGGVVLLRRSAGTFTIARQVHLAGLHGGPSGMALTHDGKTLVVTSQNRIDFLDVARFINGADPLLGSVSDASTRGHIYALSTRDDRVLFVSDEGSQSISVIDVASRAVLGKIPVGNAPVGLAFSNDEKYLFTTSQAIPGWPLACHPEPNPDAPVNHAQGAVIVVDVQQARSNPGNAVVSRVAAGCNPVRVAVSPDGARVYVSARGSHALLVFDAAKLTTDTAHALVASVDVGTSPVGVLALSDRILVTNSARFRAGADHQTLSVVDPQSLKVVGSIPAGGFPRELRLMSDGSTVLLTNFGSESLEIIDLARSTGRH